MLNVSFACFLLMHVCCTKLTVLLGVAKCALRSLIAPSQSQTHRSNERAWLASAWWLCWWVNQLISWLCFPPLTTKPACIAEAVIAPVPLPLTRNPPRSLLPPLRLLKGGGNHPLLPTPLRPAPRPGTQGLNLTSQPSPSVLTPTSLFLIMWFLSLLFFQAACLLLLTLITVLGRLGTFLTLLYLHID